MLRGNGITNRAVALESLEGRRLLSAGTVTPIVIDPGGPIIPTDTVIPINATTSRVKTTGEVIRPVVKSQFDGELGTISDVGGLATDLSNLHGNIDWGDGKTSAAVFVEQSDGTLEVDGTHAYKKTGEFHINVEIDRSAIADPGHPIPQYVVEVATLRATAQVHQNSPGGVTVNEKAGRKFTANIGSFDYTGSLALQATVNWGDGTTSQGTITKDKKDHYVVTGTHTYAKKGQYRIHISVVRGFIVTPAATVTPAKVPIMIILAQVDSTADVT